MHKASIGLDSIPSNLAIDLTDELSSDVRGGGASSADWVSFRNSAIGNVITKLTEIEDSKLYPNQQASIETFKSTLSSFLKNPNETIVKDFYASYVDYTKRATAYAKTKNLDYNDLLGVSEVLSALQWDMAYLVVDEPEPTF